jgi:outer membrane protein
MPSLFSRYFLICFIVLLGLVPFFASVVQAEGLATPIVAIVDEQKVLQSSTAVQAINKQLDAQRQKYQAEIAGEESALHTEEQALGKERASLTEQAFAEKGRAFQKKVATFERKVQARRRSLDKALSDAMDTVRTNLRAATKSAAEQRKANLVLIKQQVWMNDASLEITDTIIAELNKRLPSVAVVIPVPEDPANKDLK